MEGQATEVRQKGQTTGGGRPRRPNIGRGRQPLEVVDF